MTPTLGSPPASFKDVYPDPDDFREAAPSAAVFSHDPDDFRAKDRSAAVFSRSQQPNAPSAAKRPATKPVAVAEWYSPALERLRSLQELRSNWDTYGSPPIQNVALSNALWIVVEANKLGAPAPRIGPVSGGGVQVEWDIGKRGLELECLPDGSREYLKVEGDAMTEGPFKAAEVSDLVAWVLQG